MTREEAIKILKQRECCRECVTDCNCNECDKAFEMAIEALEQQPCEDSISRQAVFETIDDWDSDGLKGIFCSYADGERFKEYIKELPSVIPKGVTVTDFADKCRECGKQKKGKWKRYIVDNGFNADWKCTECGYKVKTDFVHYNYCPNCGARMEE